MAAQDQNQEPAPGYVAWFKADGITGLKEGDPVSVWQDSGPNGKDAAQSTASFQPVYLTDVAGSWPAIRFDGVDDRLVSPTRSDIWGLTNHFTVFAVVRLDSAPGPAAQDVIGSSSISNNLDLIARRSEGSGSWLAHSSTQDGARNADLVLTPATWYVLTWRLKAFEHVQIRANKVYRLNDTSYGGSGTAPSLAAIGARDNGVSPFKGDLAEVIFYTTSLSDADMEATEDYLLEKYGLAEIPPAAPTELTAIGSAYFRIELSWIDNADDEEGFTIERRDGAGGPWEEIGTVEANTQEYNDQSPPLSAESEFCYRISAFNTGGVSALSNEACATTLSIPTIQCYSDPTGRQRNILEGILTESSSIMVEWKSEVGFSQADPSQLQLITDDVTCQQIWDGIGLGHQPDAGPMAAFFRLGERYVVADYPLGGHWLTLVTDLDFNLINPILTD